MKVFLILLALLSAVHIAAIALQKEWLRCISKILIMPSLFAAFMAGGSGFAGGGLFALLALIFGWIGDILLIKKNKRMIFKLGIISFLLGHLCYIAVFLDCLGFFSAGGGKINITALAVFIPPAIIGGIVLFRLIKPFREMIPLLIIYMIVIEAMSCLGLEVFLFNPGFAGAMIVSGCFLFMISDAVLAYYAFRKLKVLPAILIMALYVLAQAGIIMGFLGLPGLEPGTYGL